MRPSKSKRPYGTGSLVELPSGSWRARIWIAGDRKQHTATSKPPAKAWLEEQIGARRQIAAGAQGATRRSATLAELAEEYVADLARAGARETTLNRYRSHLAVVLPKWGNLRLRDVNGPALERIVAEMAAIGWAPATVRNRLDRITGIVRYAQRRGYIEAVPLPVRRPKVTLASRPDACQREEVEALVETARSLSSRRQDPRYLAAVLLMADAGLRRSEVLRVYRADLDARARVLEVPVRGAEDQPKTGRARRVPVTKRLVEALKACPGEGPLVDLPSPGMLTVWLRDVWLLAGLEGGTRLHRLRHFWATEMARRGARLDQLMSWGGWSTLATVQRYLHAVEDADRAPVDALDRAHLGHERVTRRAMHGRPDRKSN